MRNSTIAYLSFLTCLVLIFAGWATDTHAMTSLSTVCGLGSLMLTGIELDIEELRRKRK